MVKLRISEAASAMGRRSAAARRKAWGDGEFLRRMQEYGRLGGRPRKQRADIGKKGVK